MPKWTIVRILGNQHKAAMKLTSMTASVVILNNLGVFEFGIFFGMHEVTGG
jgi:hypothetical protein